MSNISPIIKAIAKTEGFLCKTKNKRRKGNAKGIEKSDASKRIAKKKKKNRKRIFTMTFI